MQKDVYPLLCQCLMNIIVFAHGDTATEEEKVILKPLRHRFLCALRVVRRHRKNSRIQSKLLTLRPQRMGVRVPDLTKGGLLLHLDNLIASGNHGHSGRSVHFHLPLAKGCKDTCLCSSQYSTRSQDRVSLPHFISFCCQVRSLDHRLKQLHFLGTHGTSLFYHLHRIGSWWHCRSSHDLDCLPHLDFRLALTTSCHRPDDLKLHRSSGHVLAAYGIPVYKGFLKRRQVMVGHYGMGQNATQTLTQG